MPGTPAVEPVDPAQCLFHVHRDLSVTAAQRKPGPPERIDGVTVGIVTMNRESAQLVHVTPGPHGDHRPL